MKSTLLKDEAALRERVRAILLKSPSKRAADKQSGEEEAEKKLLGETLLFLLKNIADKEEKETESESEKEDALLANLVKSLNELTQKVEAIQKPEPTVVDVSGLERSIMAGLDNISISLNNRIDLIVQSNKDAMSKIESNIDKMAKAKSVAPQKINTDEITRPIIEALSKPRSISLKRDYAGNLESATSHVVTSH